MKFYNPIIKPVIDFIGAMLLIVLLSPVLVLVASAYLLSLEFPILYVQQRIGKREKPFVMFKFRTLKSEERLSLTERKFWLGTFLRATSLDEIPQLWNVLRGDMSLVGPRPMPVEYAALFSPEQRERLRVKPGITGWAQVNGRNSISWQEKFILDAYYVEHQSFLLDLRIIFKTIVLLLLVKKDVSLEEEPFRGNH